MVCGKIAAGKSTLCAELAVRPKTILISEDHWNTNLFPGELNTLEDYRRCSGRLRNTIEPHVADLLRIGVSIVLDFPANTVNNRLWMRRIFESAGAAHELHFLDISDTVCKQRLHQRNTSREHAFQTSDEDFDLFTSYFTPPTAEEGFNVVVHST
jgi:predicted kinase